MAQHPEAEVIAHPECERAASSRHAALHRLDARPPQVRADESPKQTFIVATEDGILHQMQQAAPGKTLIPAPPDDETARATSART